MSEAFRPVRDVHTDGHTLVEFITFWRTWTLSSGVMGVSEPQEENQACPHLGGHEIFFLRHLFTELLKRRRKENTKCRRVESWHQSLVTQLNYTIMVANPID